jgi:hypothetical protein
LAGPETWQIDPVIKNSRATDSHCPQLYVCTHSNATYLLRKACSERTLLLRPNEHVNTNEHTAVLNLGHMLEKYSCI